MIRHQNQTLMHYEQFVNDRLDTSPAPAIAPEFLPESGKAVPLAWKRVPCDSASVVCRDKDLYSRFERDLLDDGQLMIPVHPLEVDRFPSAEIVYSGTIRFSASYRTVFYYPEAGGPLSTWIPDGRLLMLKLHLEEPLPGIPGDRRLTRSIIEKCVYLSSVLPAEISQEEMGKKLEIVPEFFGITSRDCGVLFRLLPATGAIPVFSLFSRDRTRPTDDPLIVEVFREHYGTRCSEAAERFGRDIARPLVRSLIAGFRRGISLELHAQNTLVDLDADAVVRRVFARDMEGVVVFDGYRGSRGLEPLSTGLGSQVDSYTNAPINRLFNRNLDHDIGRIFTGLLRALRESGYFSARETRSAVRSIRIVARESILEGELGDICGLGRYLPVSRAPWGNGLRPGHYFRTQYR
jgi:hypothetical protein